MTDTADENDGKSARFARVLRDELRFLPGIGTVDSKQAVSLSLRQFMVEATSRKGGGISLEPMWWVAYRLRMAENSCNSGRAATLNSVCL